MPVHPLPTYRCSFSVERQEEVEQLIAGTGGVYICEECVKAACEAIQERRARQGDEVLHTAPVTLTAQRCSTGGGSTRERRLL
jgi:ATP-dependent protease Clp ATPase subunit